MKGLLILSIRAVAIIYNIEHMNNIVAIVYWESLMLKFAELLLPQKSLTNNPEGLTYVRNLTFNYSTCMGKKVKCLCI